MRKTICFEGELKLPHQKLLPNSLWWDTEFFPITNSGFATKPIGFARDIQREDDGRITAEIMKEKTEDRVWTLLENNDVSVTIYCTEVKSKQEDKVMVVESARLRGLFIDTTVPW